MPLCHSKEKYLCGHIDRKIITVSRAQTCPSDIKVTEQEQFLTRIHLRKAFVSFMETWKTTFCLKISFLLIANTVGTFLDSPPTSWVGWLRFLL